MNSGPTPQALPDIPGVNMKTALARLAGNAKLLSKLFGDFRTQNLDMVNQIRQTIQSGDSETAVRMLHTLKGVSANLAIDSVSEAAKEAEFAARENDGPRLETALLLLQERLDAVCSAIVQALAPAAPVQTVAPPKAEQVSAANLSPLVRQAMAETIRLANMQSPDAIFVFETIREDLHHAYPKQTAAIAESLENYAFGESAKHLADLAATLKI